MRKKKSRRHEYEEAMDDGVIEKPELNISGTQPGRFQTKTPNLAHAPVSSGFREGQVVNCPDKSKLGVAGKLTGGTIVHLFAASCLVLGHDGLIHVCFLSELA